MTDAKCKLVPIEPTDEMLKAGCVAANSTEVLLDNTRFACERAAYAAMIGAAPEPPLYGIAIPPSGETIIMPPREAPLVLYSCQKHAARVDPNDPKLSEKVGPGGFLAGPCPFCKNPGAIYTKDK